MSSASLMSMFPKIIMVDGYPEMEARRRAYTLLTQQFDMIG